MRSAILTSGAVLGSVLVASPALAVTGQPVADGTGAIYRAAEWSHGQVGFSTRLNSFNYLMTYAMSGVEVPTTPVSAGEVFYVHAWAGLPWPQSAADTAIPTLGLPEGVSVAPGSVAPTYCYIVKRDYVPTRDPGCAVFPTATTGASIPLGTYPLTAGDSDGSESVHIFVPVVASGPITAQTVFISTRMLQTPGVLPNPLYGDAAMTVGPGAPATTTPGAGGDPTPGPGAGTVVSAPVNPKYTKRGKALIVTWDAIPGVETYKARLKVGKKWTKWATVVGNGVKLTKLKKGKKYVLQVQAPGGPTSTWKFRGK